MRRFAALCAALIAAMGCDFGYEERQIPPPGKADAGDAGAPATTPAATTQELFSYCTDTPWIRDCWTGCGAIWDAGWNCDRPNYGEVQVATQAGKCKIINCTQYQADVGFQAGGFGDTRRTFGFNEYIRYQRVAAGAQSINFAGSCWSGQQYPAWGPTTIDWGGAVNFRSFGCYPL